jgi:hypothetical protein
VHTYPSSQQQLKKNQLFADGTKTIKSILQCVRKRQLRPCRISCWSEREHSSSNPPQCCRFLDRHDRYQAMYLPTRSNRLKHKTWPGSQGLSANQPCFLPRLGLGKSRKATLLTTVPTDAHTSRARSRMRLHLFHPVISNVLCLR